MLIECNRIWQYTDTDSGLIAPWYTLPALQWLKQQDVSQWRVFEYGCGYSTIWWRLNCKEIESVDSNKNWAKAMTAAFVSDKKEYIELPVRLQHFEQDNIFDCIIIDGEHREECTEFCLPYLKPGGVLIIDNWEEPGGFDCTKINELLKDWEKAVHKQPNHSNWQTLIAIKPL